MKKNIIYSITYLILTFILITIYATLIMNNISIDLESQAWFMFLIYTLITTIPIGILRLMGNKEILPIKIGIIPLIIFSIIVTEFDSAFTIYSLLYLSALNIIPNKLHKNTKK